MREITHHRVEKCGDFHEHIDIRTDEGKPTLYHITVIDSNQSVCHLPSIVFQSKTVSRSYDIDGVTNEVLLAIVRDRLEQFQKGPNPCNENLTALGHVMHALSVLQERTVHRNKQNVVQTVEPRISLIGSTMCFRLANGEKLFDVSVSTLNCWSGWAQLEWPVQRMVKASGLITNAEMDVIRGCVSSSKSSQCGFDAFLVWYTEVCLSEMKVKEAPLTCAKLNTQPIKETIVNDQPGEGMEAKAQIEKTEHSLIIGERVIPLSELESWGGWAKVESAAKMLIKKRGYYLTTEESDVLSRCASTSGARNGLAEVMQALKHTVP